MMMFVPHSSTADRVPSAAKRSFPAAADQRAMHANRAKAKPAQAYSQQESSWKLWATVGFGVLLVVFFLSPSSITTETLRGTTVVQKKAHAPLSEVIATGLELSKQAAKVIREVKREGKKAEKTHVKGKTDEGVDEPVTMADAKSNVILVNGLRTRFEGINILSEETNPKPQVITTKDTAASVAKKLENDPVLNLAEILVTVDPLDATKEFTEDLLEYVTTMICIVQDGRPIAGIIDRPFMRDEPPIWGVVPEINNGKGVVSGVTARRATGEKANVVTISRSHTGDAADVVSQYLPGKKSLQAGGAGYKSLLVVEGQAEAYVHTTKIKVWDVCAGEALVRSAGGSFTDADGNELIYTRENPVFSAGLTATLNPAKHSWYIENLKARKH